jgi:general secretion pathway protein M
MQRVVDDAATHAQEGTCEISQKMPVSNPGESPGDVYRKVAVNIGLHCDIQPLVELLYTLEKGKPYLFIQDFSVYRNPIANTQRVQSVPLEVQFTLAGYIHAAAASTDAGQAQSGGGR